MNWHELFDYDPATGKLFWKISPSQAVKAGDEAGTLCGGGRSCDKKYLRACYRRKLKQVHHVVWEMFNGPLKDGEEIDHINHIRTDNRIENLRKVYRSDNVKNRSMPINNTSGVHGVSYFSRIGMWVARIGVNGKSIFLGRYNNLEEAALARRQAEVTYGFHKNHGAKKNDFKS